MDKVPSPEAPEPKFLRHVAENSPSESDYDAVMEAIRARSKNSLSQSLSPTTSLESVIRQSPYHPKRAVNMFSSSTTSSGVYVGAKSPNAIAFSSSKYSSSSPMSPEEEEIINIFDHKKGLILLREMTRTSENF
ncbi:hypothetical protein Bca52824_091142 [Brassica carinata]|uniref:Uncharacterized protein n=1 Tax=Brassica carinata TaxID=52824 RepID=A0A8X7NVZ1_BRACI|nr:hypothetical protein Bca52824_091142 [Brassica carinata]